MDDLKPKDHAEAIAQFRAAIIGSLTCCEIEHGDLQAELQSVSKKRFRPPGASATRTFSVSTLERWYYAYRNGGLAALRPKPRKDRGRGRRLNQSQLKLLLDIRRAHSSASARLILDTVVRLGLIAAKTLTPTTLRRIYAEHGLPRRRRRDVDRDHVRLRWQAAHPHALWHGDVCHLTQVEIGGERKPVRIHAFLDDCSRDILDIRAYHTERELDMLQLLISALRKHGCPDALFLDNGATYRGETLRLACARMDMTLIHARPYQPQGRGKMERFWRTLREGCTDFIKSAASLHDINVRLWAFVEQDYRKRPHAGLFGRTPQTVMQAAIAQQDRQAIDEDRLREALTVRTQRRLRADNTISIEGVDYEVRQSFLARKTITVGYSIVDQPLSPWIEHQGRKYSLAPVDPVANGRSRKRPHLDKPDSDTPSTGFDPAEALLAEARTQIQRATGRDRENS